MIFILFLVWDHLELRPANAKRPWSRIGWDRITLLAHGGLVVTTFAKQDVLGVRADRVAVISPVSGMPRG